jgi:hypothetical protein
MGVIPASLTRNAARIKLYENARFGQKVSFPQGYQQASRAILPSLKTTDLISARITGSGDLFNFQVRNIVSVAATISGSGFVNSSAEVGKTMWATLAGTGALTGGARMLVSMKASLDAGARPSAFDIAQEVWQSQKTSYNAAGTMGNGLNNAASGGVDYSALGQAVWSALASANNTAGTMGAAAQAGGSAPTASQNAAAIRIELTPELQRVLATLTTGQFLALKD